MSDVTNDGGAAFPVPPVHLNLLNGDPHWSFPYTGMTLRDYFAAAVLQGRVARCGHNGPWSDIAQYSYEAADAMLAERIKTKEAQP